METILRVKFGSNLYGTNTPESDTDYKSIHIPDGKSIIMQRVEDVIINSTNDDRTRNTSSDIDDESFSIAKFISMCQTGDMVAYELLHVTPEQAEYMSDEWLRLVHLHRRKFMSADISGYLGYIRSQVNKYGIKGSRIATARAARDMFDLYRNAHGYTRVKDIDQRLYEFCENNDHASIVYLASVKGSDQKFPYFEVLNRKIDFRTSLGDAYKIMNKIFEEYGSRALAAEQGTGVDWKSVYHAVRVSEQALELTMKGTITFPRPNVDTLLKIKRGEFEFKKIAEQLENNLDVLEFEMNRSKLPRAHNVKYMNNLVENLYLTSVEDYY